MFQHPIWAMAFRPFYLLAALFGACSILAWLLVLLSIIPAEHLALPAMMWHAKEMIWGYAGAVIVGFLLTAVATWTGQPATRGLPLAVLALLWLVARLAVFLPQELIISTISGTAFFWYAAFLMGQSVWRARNKRNYIAVAALFLFGCLHAAFHLQTLGEHYALLLNAAIAGLVMVAAFISLVGMRIMPFFTAKRLGIAQVSTPQAIALAALFMPMIMAILLANGINNSLTALLGLASGILNFIQVIRWWHKGVLKEPMLWILFVGYAATALGLMAIGLSAWGVSNISLGVHLIGVGGIGLLTLGMMARTALGHTGQAIYPGPASMHFAFKLMLAATIIRACAAVDIWGLYSLCLAVSGGLFAAALLMYALQYAPWLLRPRLDGKPG